MENDNKIGSILIIIVSALFWVIGLAYGSGIGAEYSLYEKMISIILIFSSIYILVNKGFLNINRTWVYIFVFVIVHNIYTQIMYGNNYFEYACLYLIVVLFSNTYISKTDIRLIGIIYGFLGGALLIVANNTNYLAGWDGNTISMISFFSYTLFAASRTDLRKLWKTLVFILYSVFYFIQLDFLNSRSSIVFSIVLVLCIVNVIPIKRVLKKRRVNLILLTPLIVALFVVIIKNSTIVYDLNAWSIENFQKPIFNGRDNIFLLGLQRFMSFPVLGCGSLAGNWHNSAITCIVGTGMLGYIMWLLGIKKCWMNACYWINDDTTYGLLIAFVIIWLQQSVELGLIQERGNPIIFVILGLLMARVHTLNALQLAQEGK